MKCKDCHFWELYRPDECGQARFNWIHNADMDCPKDLEEEELHTLDGDSAEDRCLGDVGI